jgi:3-hydroxyisobutyrate dehydrogenase-like beta-hydroxyacid dehydrogenase
MNVGFVGLGNMGAGMVENLLSAGVAVAGYDVDNRKATELKKSGLKVASSIAEIANCNVVVLCLPNPDVSREVIAELLKSNVVEIIIETSTLTPEIALDFAEQIKSAGKKFLSAPMIGGKNSAINKTIHFIVEGDKNAYEMQRELLEYMSAKVEYMGDVPSATLAKIVFNMCRYANIAVAAEAIRLLRPYSPDMTSIYEFMSEQSLDNFGQVWAEDMRQMITAGNDYEPSQVPEKDLKLFAEIAEKNQLNTELLKAILSTYKSLK